MISLGSQLLANVNRSIDAVALIDCALAKEIEVVVYPN